MSFSIDAFMQSFDLPSDKSNLPLNLYFDLWSELGQTVASKKVKTTHGVLDITAYLSVEAYVNTAGNEANNMAFAGPSAMSFRAQTLMKATLIPETMPHQDRTVYVVLHYSHYASEDYCLMYMFRSRQDARDFSATLRRQNPKIKLSAIGRYVIQGV